MLGPKKLEVGGAKCPPPSPAYFGLKLSISRNAIKPPDERVILNLQYLNCIGIENLWIGVSMTHILENIQAQVTIKRNF